MLQQIVQAFWLNEAHRDGGFPMLGWQQEDAGRFYWQDLDGNAAAHSDRDDAIFASGVNGRKKQTPECCGAPPTTGKESWRTQNQEKCVDDVQTRITGMQELS